MSDVVAPIQEKLDRLELKAERLRTALAETERQCDALRTTLEILSPKQAPKRERRRAELNVSPDDVRGKQLDDALVFVAERNDGEIVSSAARPLLIEAGVLKGSQTSNRLWQALSESDRFEQVGRGRYRLVGDRNAPMLRALS